MAWYLAEWHRSGFTEPATTTFVSRLQSGAAELAMRNGPVRLTLLMSVTADTTVYGLFESNSAEAVLRVCARAAALPQRLHPDVDARFADTTVHAEVHGPTNPL